MTIVFFSTSCSTSPDKLNNKFDTLPLPIDSSAFYFKTKAHWQDTTQNGVDSFVNSWYSKMLFALKEPIIKDYKGDKEIYRFTWLRTFNHPVSIRLEKQGSIVRLFRKICSGAGGYEPGKILFDTVLNLTQKQIDTINLKLDNSNFWALQTEMRNETGMDGSEWIIEVVKKNKYHMAVRWTPSKERQERFREIGEYLISLADLKQETTKQDYY